jgi:hypothetical protein
VLKSEFSSPSREKRPSALPIPIALTSSAAEQARLRIIEIKEASNINGGYSLGKREVVSSILTGSTRNS